MLFGKSVTLMKQWLSSVMAVLFFPRTSCVYNRSLKRELATYRSWRTQSKRRRLMEIVETNASESSARVGLKLKTLLPLCEWHLKSVGAGQKRTEMEVKKKQYFQRVKDELKGNFVPKSHTV